MVRRLALVLVLVGTGCVTTHANTGSDGTSRASPTQAKLTRHSKAEDDEHKVVCEYTKEVGTHIPEETCRLVSTVENDRRAAQEEIMRLQQLMSQQKLSGQ